MISLRLSAVLPRSVCSTLCFETHPLLFLRCFLYHFHIDSLFYLEAKFHVLIYLTVSVTWQFTRLHKILHYLSCLMFSCNIVAYITVKLAVYQCPLKIEVSCNKLGVPSFSYNNFHKKEFIFNLMLGLFK